MYRPRRFEKRRRLDPSDPFFYGGRYGAERRGPGGRAVLGHRIRVRGGTELPASGFLVLRLISYWTYTVWKYHQLLCRHLSARLGHFRERLDPDTLAPEGRHVYDTLVSKGFACPSEPRNVSLALYAASLALIVSGLAAEVLVAQGRIGMAAFERFVLSAVGAAALLFAVSWARASGALRKSTGSSPAPA